SSTYWKGRTVPPAPPSSLASIASPHESLPLNPLPQTPIPGPSLSLNPSPQILNLLEGVDNASCSAIFTRFDNLELARIVGSSRSTRMLQSPNHTFMFC
ncbi:unnamed protein product, partial [Closterium sp. NIES-53]